MDKQKTGNDSAGQVRIADDVIAIIAGLAISDQEGIDEKAGKKGKGRSVTIQMEEGQVVCQVDLTVTYGTKVPELAEQVQQKIKTAVENMTGLSVKAVHVNIVSMNMGKVAKEA